MGKFTKMSRAKLMEEMRMCNWRISVCKREVNNLCCNMERAARKAEKVLDTRRRARLDAMEDYMIGAITEEEYRKILKNANEKIKSHKDYRRKIGELEDIIDKNIKNLAEIKTILKHNGYDPRFPENEYNPRETRGRPPLSHEMTPQRILIINRIRWHMIQRELTKADLSILANINRSNLSAYLTGNRNFSDKVLKRVAVALGLTIEQLLSDELLEGEPQYLKVISPRKPLI